MKYLIAALAVLITIPGNAQAQSELAAYFGGGDKYQNVLVQKVLSADTIVILFDNNEDETIQMIGLRAPEVLKKKDEPVERDQYGFPVKNPLSPLTPIEEEAFDFVSELLTGQQVRLEFDVDRNSKDFKTPAYVFLKKNDTFVNAEILRKGYSELQIRPPNTKYAEKLRAAYKEARDEKRGMQNQ